MSIINAMVRGLASAGIPPNVLTLIGVTINLGCGVLFGFGEFFWAGVVATAGFWIPPLIAYRTWGLSWA